MEKERSNIEENSTQEPVRQINLSSNLTLFWRVFLPVFGTVFFSGLSLAIWLIDGEDLYLSYSIWWPRLIILLIWIGWLYVVKTRFWPLKRIDADPEHLFVTNYWTTVRYPWTDVAQLKEIPKWHYRLVQLELKAPGRFGQVITFLPGSRFQPWMETQGKAGLIVEQE
ncbi:MAG: hypothetical protein KDD14_07780 [Saprospiraceae bacterium]|nr:hypothetical protein [Saprospiraceae bacterium]